jgi:hypothetical protein
MKAILRQIAGLCLLCASTSAFAGNFSVGYDEAWFADNYPDWLASNPVYNLLFQTFQFSSKFSTTSSVMDAYFATMASGGAKIVRIWVFPGLQGIQLDLSQPPGKQTVGLTLDAKGNPELIGNLQTVFIKAKKYGLQVQVTALNGVDMQAVVDPTSRLHPLQAYFENVLLNNGGERDNFKKKVLLPLLNLFNATATDENGMRFQIREVIYGLDVINEIEAPLIAGYFPTYWLGARDFIQDMAKYAKLNSSVPVTSSAGFSFAAFEILAGLFSGLGLNFYDLHAYADYGLYPGLTLVCGRVLADRVPIILGEYGQSSQTTDNNRQSLTTASFLFRAKATCYSAALAWMYQTNLTPKFKYICTTPGDPLCKYPPLANGIGFRPAYFVIQSFH